MARPLRLKCAGAQYDGTSRGEVPQTKRRSVPRSLPQYDRAHADRNEAIKAAYASGGYTMKEMGDYFGLHHSRVRKIICGAPGRGGHVQAHVKT
jgi:hypothetical protein